MTLFRQMAIAISLIIIIMLGAVMSINYQSAKQDMILSLYETTVNNISALANTLATAQDDRAHTVSIIDSEFDSGYYKSIEFKSNSGNLDYKQLDSDLVEGVPLWFINFSNIPLESVSMDVSSGWNILGIVSVEGDTGVVYKALYKMLINLSYIFLVSVTLSILILGILLHFVLKPLSKIQHQAEAILNNEFIIQKDIPFTTEFRDVVKGMNAMVKKVEDIFNKGNVSAQRNRELLYNDSVTKLFNRRYLMLKLPELIKSENRADGGIAIFIALSGAKILNQMLGHKKADKFFLELGAIFNSAANAYDEKLIARVNGTEFTLILPGCEALNVQNIVEDINTQTKLLLEKDALNEKEIHLDMGMYKYKPTTTLESLLTRADSALSLAKAKENENTHLYEECDSDNALGKEQWRKILEESIKNKHFSLKFWPTLNAQKKQLEHSVMTFNIGDAQNREFLYGDFIAPAINLGLVSRMYLIMLRELISNHQTELSGTECSIRLSNEFLKDTKSFSQLSKLFKEYAKTLKFSLSFEVSDNFAMNNIEIMKRYVELFNKYNFGFGINTFSAEAQDYNYLKQLNPKFIKAESAFLLDQSEDSMSAIGVITDSLGIEIIASFVKTQEELESLAKMHIHTIQGPITDKLSVTL